MPAHFPIAILIPKGIYQISLIQKTKYTCGMRTFLFAAVVVVAACCSPALCATNVNRKQVDWVKALRAEETFAASKAGDAEQKQIITDVEKTSFDAPESWNKELVVRRVQLGSADGLIVRGTQLLCGGTGNCQTWVFRHSEGKWLNLFEQEAPVVSSFGFEQETAAGIKNFVVEANNSAGQSKWIEYQFDGEYYRQSDCYDISRDSEGTKEYKKSTCK